MSTRPSDNLPTDKRPHVAKLDGREGIVVIAVMEGWGDFHQDREERSSRLHRHVLFLIFSPLWPSPLLGWSRRGFIPSIMIRSVVSAPFTWPLRLSGRLRVFRRPLLLLLSESPFLQVATMRQERKLRVKKKLT